MKRNNAQISILDEIIVDNFAGGGGASTGIELAAGRPVAIAINHDPDAILLHKTNHPYTEHLQASVWDAVQAGAGQGAEEESVLEEGKAGEEMKIGLIDVDSHHYPNLALMKISAYHKSLGDSVEWWWGFGQYDRVYMSKVFDSTYSQDMDEPLNAREIIKGGTGYGLCNRLPEEIEHCEPDYSLYPELTKDTAYGFLTRGCPNACPFCIVSGKEGRVSRKVADLSEWWSGQKNIVLMDPNLLACREHMDLLGQLAASGALVDINQGLDARLLNIDNIRALNQIRIKEVHFAWDLMKNSKQILRGLNLWKRYGKKDRHGKWGTVYVLVNFNTSMAENLYRIYTLDRMGFDPYVMIYDKPNAPREIRDLQRWCDNKYIFGACKRFEDYGTKKNL